MEKQLTQAELDERVAILKKFRSLLEMQRTKFQEYLNVLELQESRISMEDADAIIAHSELENQIVQGIGALQKVIEPMQALYNTSNAAKYNPQDAIPITNLQNDLQQLQKQVLAQNEKNRASLKLHIADLKQQMVQLKNPYKTRQSVYAERSNTGSYIYLNA